MAVSSTTATNRKALADALASINNSPSPTASRTTSSKIEETVTRNLRTPGYGTNLSPTFKSYAERVPSYLDSARRIEKTGAAGTASFTNSWMRPQLSYEQTENRPQSLFGINKLNPLNYISGSDALYAVGKPLSAVAAFVDVTADYVTEAWRAGDLNPFDKESWSWDALTREYDRTQNILTDWNRQTGTGLGDSDWNQIYTFGEVLHDQNWLQGDVLGWSGSELTVIPDWVPVLPSYKQRVSPSGLVGTVLNVWADPLTGIRNVGAGVDVAMSLSKVGQGAQQATARNAYRNAYMDALTREGIDVSDNLVVESVEELVQRSTNEFLGLGGVQTSVSATKKRLQEAAIPVTVEGKQYGAIISNNSVAMVQDLGVIQARLLNAGRSSISSKDMNRVGEIAQKLGVNGNWQTQKEFGDFVASMAAQNRPVANNFQRLVNFGVDTTEKSGALSTTVGWRLTGTGPAGRGIINGLNRVTRRVINTKGHRVRETLDDFMTEPIAMQFFSTNNPGLDLFLRSPGIGFQNLGRRIGDSKLGVGWRKGFSGRGADFKQTIRNGHHKVPLAQRTAPGDVVRAKEALRSLSRGTQMGRKADGVFDTMRRGWQDSIIPILRQKLPGVADAELGVIIRQAVANPDAVSFEVGGTTVVLKEIQEAIEITQKFTREVGEEAHRLGGDEFLSFIDNWTPRVLTDEAADAIGDRWKANNYTPRGSFAKSGMEKKRRYVSPKQYEDDFKKFVETQGESVKDLSDKQLRAKFDSSSDSVSDEFLGHKFLEPNELGYKYGNNPGIDTPAPDIDTQIADIMQASGMDHRLFEPNLFTAMSAYTSGLAKRTGDAWAETLMLRKDVLLSTDGWVTGAYFPTAAQADAASKLRSNSIRVEKARKDLVNRIRISVEEGDLNKAFNDDAIESLEKVLLKALDDEADAVKALDAAEIKRVEATRIRDAAQSRADELVKTDLASRTEIAELRMRYGGDDTKFTKAELARVTKLEKERQTIQNQILSIEMGTNVAKGYQDGLYFAHWDEARNAIGFKFLVERGLTQTFKDVDTARQFVTWYKNEFETLVRNYMDPQAVQARGLLPDQSLENFADEAATLNQAINDPNLIAMTSEGNIPPELRSELMSKFFKTTDELGNDIVIPAAVGIKTFEDVARIIDQDSIGEWLVLQDIDRFLPGVMGEYKSSPGAVFSALELAEESIEGSLSVLDDIVGRALENGADSLAARSLYPIPSKENLAAATEVLEQAARMGDLQVAMANNRSGYNRVAEALSTGASPANAPTRQQIDEATRLHFSINGKTNLVSVENINDLNKILNDYAEALLRRQKELEVAIGASPVGELVMPVPGTVHSDFEFVGLPTYVSQKQFQEAYFRGLQDGSQMRIRTSDPLASIQKNGRSITPEQLFDPSPNNPFAAMGLTKRYGYAQNQGRDLEFWLMPNGKVYEIDSSKIYDAAVPDPVASAPVANAVYRELGIPVRDIAVEYTPGPFGSDNWVPSNLKQSDVNSQSLLIDSDELVNSQTYINEQGQPGWVEPTVLDELPGTVPPPAAWTSYDANSQIGMGFAADLLLGNFSVGRDGSMFVDKLGRLSRGDMLDTFGHRAGSWADDLPRESSVGRLVDPEDLDAQAQMLDEMVELPQVFETLPTEQGLREGFTLQELIDDGWRTADGTGFSDDYVASIRGWIDSMGREGIDFSGQFAQQVDNILALRSKYGGWKSFVAQHGDMLGVARRDQAEYMVNFLETRTKELADMTQQNWFEAGSEELLRNHGVRMGIDAELIQNTNRDELLHLIRTENGGHGTLKGGPIPHTISPDVSGRPGLDAGYTWSDGTALNLTLSPLAYGSEFATIADEAMLYRQFVLDLSGGGKVRFYGQDPWREEAARQLLLRMGKDPVSDFSTLDDFLNSMEMLGNQASRPYGFIDERIGTISPSDLDPRAMVEGQRIFEALPDQSFAGGPARGFDTGLGEMAVDIFTRLNDDTLDELIGFVSPKQSGMLLAARSAPWDANDDVYFRLAEIIKSKGGPERVRVSDIPDEPVKMWRKGVDAMSRDEALAGTDEQYFQWVTESASTFSKPEVYEEVSLRSLWKDVRKAGDNKLGYQKEWVDRYYDSYIAGTRDAMPRSRTEVYAKDPSRIPAKPDADIYGGTTLGGASRPADYNFFQASSNAFIEAKSLVSSTRFGRYFAQTGANKKPLQNALEFVGWRDMMLRRTNQAALGDLSLMPSSSDNLEALIFKFFRATDPEFNPTQYGINQAIASRGAARHSDTMLRGVYERYFQIQARAGHLEELGSFQNFRKKTRNLDGKELEAFVTASPYDSLVPRPHMAKTPETSLVSRMMNEYHLSLAADGYGGTAWLNHIDEVKWSSYADDLFERAPKDVVPQPPSNYFVNVTATNPYVLRPGMDIDDLVSGKPVTEMDQVIKDGVVDSRRLLELFEHRAENVLTSPPHKNPNKIPDPLREAVEAQQLATRTLPQINMEYEKMFTRLDDVQTQAADAAQQIEIINAIRSEATQKVERLKEAMRLLEDIQTRPASAVGGETSDSLNAFRAQFGYSGNAGTIATDPVRGLGDDIRSLGQPIETVLPPGFGTELSALEFKNLEDQIRHLAVGDLAELNNFLDVALADDIGDAITRLEAAGPAVRIVKGMPSVEPTVLSEVMERTLRAGIQPVGTRSQGTEGIVNGIMAFDTIAANGGVNRFIKRGGYFDRTHNLMKGYMTASMGFLARNGYGGMFMNWMAGVVPTRYPEFIRALMVANVRAAKEAAGEVPLTGVQRQLEKRVAKWSVPEEHVSYVRILQDQGAFGGTQAGIEFDPGLGRGRTVKVGSKEIELSSFSPINSKFMPLQGVRGANVKVETMLRGTLGLDRMIKSGGVVDDAFDDIWKYHFNYDDLSQVERRGVKRATSFYTWIRHAIPLVAQSYYKNPTIWQRYVQTMSTVADDDSKGWDEMAPWLRRQGAVPIGWEYKGNNLTFSPDVPIRSFFDMVSPIFEKDKSIGQRLGIAPSETGGVLTSGLSMLNPMLKSPAEYVTKRNFWKGYNYSGRYERVPNQLTTIPGLMPAMNSFFSGGADPEMYYDEEGEFWAMKDSLLASTFQLLPPLNTARRLFPDEKRFQERAISSWISWLSGVGLRTNTDWEIEKTRRNDIYRQFDELDRMEDRIRLRAETRAGLN